MKTNKKNKKVKEEFEIEVLHEYKCFKCGGAFIMKHEIDTDKPTCNDCFEKLKKIDNVKDYYEFIK